MQVDAWELVEQLRSFFVVDIDGMEIEAKAVAVFDRACVMALGAVGNRTKELTRGQRAAATRARNKKAAAENGGGEPAGE